MEKSNIEKLIDETINSFDGSKRAEPKPFLITRVTAKMNRTDTSNFWTRVALFLTRPTVAIVGVLLVLLLNAAIIVNNMNDDIRISFQSEGILKDDYTTNIGSIYDIENREP